MKHNLTLSTKSCQTDPAAQKKAAWFDSQNNEAGNRARRYFFARNKRPDSMSESGGRPQGLSVLYSDLSTRPYSLTLLTGGDEINSHSTGGHHHD